jgi:hypothetical protein
VEEAGVSKFGFANRLTARTEWPFASINSEAINAKLIFLNISFVS